MLSEFEIERIAQRTADILYWKMQNPTAKWISQRKAFQIYGEANVRRLFGKIATNQRGNRIELYLPDIEKHLQPKKAVEK